MIKSFKKRDLVANLPVKVHRNLQLRGRWYSISQGGKVVAHADHIILENVRFQVSDAGRARCIKEGSRNVHAWAKGYIVAYGGIPTNTRAEDIRYNPFKDPWFQSRTFRHVGGRRRYGRWTRIEICDFAQFGPHGSTAWFYDPDYKEFECDCI